MGTNVKKVIAIDFDGTITEPSPYPITGAVRPKAIEVIKKLQNKYTCVLWTCRCGSDLVEAINILKIWGIKFKHINESPSFTSGRKIHADVYIDDKAFGAKIDWDEIEKVLLKD